MVLNKKMIQTFGHLQQHPPNQIKKNYQNGHNSKTVIEIVPGHPELVEVEHLLSMDPE